MIRQFTKFSFPPKFVVIRYIHVVENSLQKKKVEDRYDPLFKVRPLIDHLSAVSHNIIFQGATSPLMMMIVTRCKISFLQYLPKKPTKFGIKVLVNANFPEDKINSPQLFRTKPIHELVQPLLSVKAFGKGKAHKVTVTCRRLQGSILPIRLHNMQGVFIAIRNLLNTSVKTKIHNM